MKFTYVSSITSQVLLSLLRYDVINIPRYNFACFSLTRIIKHFIHQNQELGNVLLVRTHSLNPFIFPSFLMSCLFHGTVVHLYSSSCSKEELLFGILLWSIPERKKLLDSPTFDQIMIFSSPEPSGSQGELIVYPCSGVSLSIGDRLSTIFKNLRQSKPNFMGRIHGKDEQKFIEMVQVT